MTVTLDKAQWREERRKLVADAQGPIQHESYFVRTPALQKLMQNFKRGEPFFEQTGLVYPADAKTGQAEQVLTTDSTQLVEICRALDVGKHYQQHLDSVFDADCQATLAADKQGQLSLAIELAAVKGQLPVDDLNMLRRVVAGKPLIHAQSRWVVAGALKVLGCRVEGALAFERQSLTTPFRNIPPFTVQAVILYLPGDPEQPLRAFANWREASWALGSLLHDPSYQRAFAQRIALADRPEYLTTLRRRLADAKPDATCSCEEVEGPLLQAMAAQQLQRIRDNARFLAVPTAQVDARVSAEHLQTLEAAGMGLLNLAGLFVPVIGTLLAVGWVGQIVAQTCEGFEDWSQGHQHEAMEHLLGVAETVVIATALIAGTALVARGFARSAVIDHMVPVLNDADEPRLWSGDITHYEDKAPPADLLELDNGLLANGQGHWWRNGATYYQVRPVEGRSVWQLHHPRRQASFGPVLEFNGERSWRLAMERPLEWEGESVLLERLWPSAASLGAERVGQILKVAAVDQAHLRGLLVEGRPLPVELRDTLERFAVDARIDAFMTELGEGQVGDSELFQWCSDYLKADSLPLEEQRLEFVDREAWLSEQLFEHFSRKYLATDPLLPLIQRDFKGLPDAYALDVLNRATDAERRWMLSEQRIPFDVAQRARAHLQLAQLARVREGLYLKGSYRPDTVALVFALLRKHARLSQAINIELREGSDLGPLQAQLHPARGSQQITITLVRKVGGFKCYDVEGRELDGGLTDAATLAQVLARHLAGSDLARLTWGGAQASEQIMNALRAWLPADRAALLRLMGLREIKPSSNPMRRLADGRIGYLLNGRDEALHPSRRSLLEAAGALYPSFGTQDLDFYVSQLLLSPQTAYIVLIQQYGEYLALDRRLQAWMMEVPSGSARGVRRHVAQTLRRNWRLEGFRVNPAGVENHVSRLSLIGFDLRSLPVLPANTNFGHVTELVLVGLRLEALPQGFLRCFTRLRWLNLSNNTLAHLPAEIGELNQLTTLDVSRNRLRMTEGTAQALGRLRLLVTLDLSVNPLGRMSLQLGEFSRLRDVNLRLTNLQSVPAGLERCGQLEIADLRDNQIAQLPERLLLAPLQVRRAVELQNNPLPIAERERLTVVNPVPLVPPQAAVGWAQHRANWLLHAPLPTNTAYEVQWDGLRAADNSEEFFRLLQALTHTSDYERVPQDLGRRVWTMIGAASEDSTLRGELFELAASRGCVDRVIACFSTLEVRVLLARAMRSGAAAHQQTSLLELARGLFRLEQVEGIARQDIEQRVAFEQDRLRNTGLSVEDAAMRAREHVDEVEVSLAYRIGLAARLGLPGQPQTMQFGRLAGVTQAQLNNAAAAVRWSSATQDLQAYISQRDYWVEYLERQHAARFDSVKQPFWDQLEALQGLTDSEQLTRTAHIQSAFKQAVDDLVQQLTREALRNWHPGD
ncbi:TPA: hypothetical protein QEM96_002224 [Pseudomonas putida]|nr:hypothetical protein [Pseudomonas putida]